MLFGITLKAIVAGSVTRVNDQEQYVIGNNGDMPWKGLIPSDMRRFIELTSNFSVGIGRKTWDSIPQKFRPFNCGRQTIIITRDKSFTYDHPDVAIAYNIPEALGKARTRTVWIAGGGEIYKAFFPYLDEIHLTVVRKKFAGDTFFPHISRNQWYPSSTYEKHAGSEDNKNDKIDTTYIVFRSNSQYPPPAVV